MADTLIASGMASPTVPATLPADTGGTHADTGTLREGFTTGTAAAAAACAAFHLLLGQAPHPAVSVPLPPFSDSGCPRALLDVPVHEVKQTGPRQAEAIVIKDGGDDPDVTHKARITAAVELVDPDRIKFRPTGATSADAMRPDDSSQWRACPPLLFSSPLPMELHAGPGIGRVTLPGLPVPVGEPAINPVPRVQLHLALAAAARRLHYSEGVRVTLSIQDGEDLARKTFNPRLGIVGGLSILGTHGTVRPYSHDAWQASIVEGLSVARATGCTRVGLSTGRRSERLLQAIYPSWPAHAFIQAADFAAFSLQAAAAHDFIRLAWGCFFGKLVKLALGLPSTHARDGDLDFAALAAWCRAAGLNTAQAEPLHSCNTAGQALEYILACPRAPKILQAVTCRAKAQAERFARSRGTPVQVTVHLFHINGKELARA